MNKIKKKILTIVLAVLFCFFAIGQVQGAPYVGDVAHYLIPNFDYTGYSCDLEKEFSLNVIDMDFSWDGTGIDFAVCFSPIGSYLDVPVQYHDFLLFPYQTFYDPIYKGMGHYMGSSSCGWCENYNNPECGCEWMDINGHIHIDDWENAGLIIDDELVIDFYIEYSGHKRPEPELTNYFFCSEYVGSVLFNLNDGTFEPTEPTEPPEPDPIAGECGTPNEQVYIGSEGLPELEDLCSVGELDSLIAVPVGDFNIFTYKCLGEHGGDDASCGFYQYTGTGQPGEPSPACGSADGKVYHYPLEPDPDHLCAFGEVQGYQYNAETYKWNWRCSRGNFSAWCSASRAYDFDLPEIDFDEWEFDFEEGETSKNWLVEIFKFVFLPKDSTIESFLNNFNELKTKIPLGYLDLILNKFKDVDIQEKQVILELDIFGTDVEVWNIEEFKEEHSGLWNIVQGMLKVAIWFVFLVYIFHRARSIFNNSE